jgi:O-antigen ligase
MQKLLELFKNKHKELFTALLIVIPLFPKFPALDIANTYVNIRLEDFLILFSLIYFLPLVFKNIKVLFNNKVIQSMLIYLFVGLISLIAGIFLTQTVISNVGMLHLVRRIEYFSLFVIGFLFIYINKKRGIFEYIIKVLLLINLVIFLYGIGQRYFNLPVIITQNSEYSKGIALRWVSGAHINSTFAGHYDMASYLVLTLPLFIATFFKKNINKTTKIIVGVSIAFGFWLLSSAVSRISIISFGVATTVTLLLLKKYKEIVIIGAISLLVFGFSPDLRVRYKRIFDVVREKISQVVVVYAAESGESKVVEDRSTSIRLVVEWPRAIRALEKNPILGTGYSSITLATDNDYLRALGETGTLGLVSFLMIFVCIYLYLKKCKFGNGYKSIFIAGFVGSTIAISITAIFIDIFESSKFAIYYWLTAGIVVGSVLKNKRK